MFVEWSDRNQIAGGDIDIGAAIASYHSRTGQDCEQLALVVPMKIADSAGLYHAVADARPVRGRRKCVHRRHLDPECRMQLLLVEPEDLHRLIPLVRPASKVVRTSCAIAGANR